MHRKRIARLVPAALCLTLVATLGLAGCSDDDSAPAVTVIEPDDIDPADTSTTPTGTTSSTAGVVCDYVYNEYNASASVDAMSESSWTCSNTSRELTANGIPDHDVGTFPNPGNPNTLSEQNVSASYTLNPIETDTATTLGGPSGAVGYVLNGIKMDPSTGGSCDDSGETCSGADPTLGWNLEALGQTSFDFGADMNNAPVF